MACSYCFFLDKEALYPGSSFRMPDEVLENYLAQLIAGHRTNEVTVAWQGGEPTIMGIDFYRRAIALQEKHKKPGMTFENTMQTNGTLLNDDWCEFFKEHDYLIGLSIDGPRRLHDANRVDKGGRPTFDKVMRGLRPLQKHGVDFNVLTTVNSANAGLSSRSLSLLTRRGGDELDAVHSHRGAHQRRRHHAASAGKSSLEPLG